MKYIDNRLNAKIVKLQDENNNYTSENVEGALEEIDSKIKIIEANGYDDTKIRQHINNIKTEIGTEELTTNSKNIKGSVNELNSQIKEKMDKKNTGIISVKEFGAIGDGVSDDTSAIQNAIDYLLNNYNKGTLYFPAGTYNISSQLNMYKNGVGYTIKGDNRRKTKIVATKDMNSMLKLNSDNNTYVSYKISDIFFNLSTHADIGVDASYVVYSTIQNCYFETNKDNSKMLVISSWCNRIINNLFTGSYSYVGTIPGLEFIAIGTAIYMPSNLSTNNIVIQDNVIQQIENAIVIDDFANDIHIHSNTFDKVGRVIVSMKGLKNCTFHYNYCEICGGTNKIQYTLNPFTYTDGNYTRELLTPFILTEDVTMVSQFKTCLSMKYNQFANCYNECIVTVSLPRDFEFTNNDFYSSNNSYTYNNVIKVIGKGIYNNCKMNVETNNTQIKNIAKWDINNAAYYADRGDINIYDLTKQPTFDTVSKSTPISNVQNYIVNTTKSLREFSLGLEDYKNPFKIIVDFEKISGSCLKYDLYTGSTSLMYNVSSNTSTTSQLIYFANEMQTSPYKDFKLWLYSDGDIRIKSVKLIIANKYNKIIDLLR